MNLNENEIKTLMKTYPEIILLHLALKMKDEKHQFEICVYGCQITLEDEKGKIFITQEEGHKSLRIWDSDINHVGRTIALNDILYAILE